MEIHWLPGPALSCLKLAPWAFLVRGADRFHVVGSAGGSELLNLIAESTLTLTLQSTVLGTVLQPCTQSLC